MAKLSAIVLLSWWMARVQRNPGHWRNGMVVPGAMLGSFALVILAEPDFGTAMLIGSVGMAILFVGGARIGYLLLASVGAAALLGLLIAHNPERSERILAFLDPWKHAQDAAYQLTQGIYAFVCGGPNGVGLGQSIQKRYFLPEAHTDFIFAILGEELGLRGSLSVALLFFVFFICGMWIAFRTEDRFGKLLAFGITLLLTAQSGLNMGVVTGLLPTKGIPLPFISSGGSSMLISLAMVGILVNIGQAMEFAEDEGGRPFSDDSSVVG
jgi:cell division protein FtsW